MNNDFTVTPVYSGGFEALGSLLQAGGPVVMILMIMSVIALAIILLNLWQFSSLRLGATDFVKRALVLAGTPEAAVREEAARVATVELEKLRGNLRGLELIGSLSPLLGFLGTVLGLITAFLNCKRQAVVSIPVRSPAAFGRRC